MNGVIVVKMKIKTSVLPELQKTAFNHESTGRPEGSI